MSTQRFNVAEMVNYVLDTHQIHSIFTILLNSLSRPGDIHQFSTPLVEQMPPAVLPLMCVVSHRTPFCIVGDHQERTISPLIENVTGGIAVPLEDAAYVSFLQAPTDEELSRLRQGDALHPDHAAQIAVSLQGQMEHSDSTTLLQLSGPGVDGTTSIRLPELPTSLVKHFESTATEFPAGIDVWLVDEVGNIVGIPRSSTIHITTTQGGH